ncbi:alcohol oxidase, partial [Hymenopellis radicata]
MMALAMENPKYDWAYHTVPQAHAGNRRLLQSHGKGLGGSSLLNFLCFVRPTKEEFDALEELGNPGWNWDNLLSYMKKSERIQALSPSVDGERVSAIPNANNHGTEGAIAKSFPSHITEIVTPMLDSLEAIGVPRKPDASDGRPIGGFLSPTSVDMSTFKRSYAASGYFAPNKDLPNLLVVTEVSVLKINFEGTRATGVTVQQNDKTFTVNASKEVVVSAGSLHTPQILELSGVGNASILEPLGIKSIVNLPGVGENLQDHGLVSTVVEVPETFKSFELFKDPAQACEQQELYKKGDGLLAGASSCFAFLPASTFASPADVSTWSQTKPDSEPDLFPTLDPTVRKGIEKQYEILRRWAKDDTQPFGQLMTINGHYTVPGVTPDPAKRYTTICCAFSHPFSRGRIHITSSSPAVPPDLNPRYLSNSTDREIIVRLLEFTEKLLQVSPVKDIVKQITVPSEKDKEDLGKFVGDVLATIHHPVGTSSMLPRELGGVVDQNLRVYGVENLRIADNSIVPLEICSNTQSYAYAIGEKAADLILADL